MDTLLGKIQKLIVLVLTAMLVVVVVLSTVHLGVLIAERNLEAAPIPNRGAGPA